MISGQYFDKVKFSKLKICQSDCRFKILGNNCQNCLFFLNFGWNIVKISVKYPKRSKITLLFEFDLILIDVVNFDYVPVKILKKETFLDLKSLHQGRRWLRITTPKTLGIAPSFWRLFLLPKPNIPTFCIKNEQRSFS